MEGRIIGGRYEYRKNLGKGGNGSVFLCYDLKLQKEWAVKELYAWEEVDFDGRNEEKEGNESDGQVIGNNGMSEAELLKTISCTLFPRIVDVVYEQNKTYLVMDYVEGVTLREMMNRQRITEKEVVPWAVEIAKALQYLHQMSPKILYMDCKPENILLTPQGEIRLVDLGSVYICGSEKKQRISGTRFFSPPEQKQPGIKLFKNSKKQDGLSEPDVCNDIYAFGMTLYYLLAGKKKIYRRNGRLSIKDANPKVSEGMNAIIASCTEYDTSKRLQSMDEVLYRLMYIKEIDRMERLKNSFLKITASIVKCLCAVGVLICAWYYVINGEMSMLYGGFGIAVLFLLLCRKQKFTLYEVKKEVFCGSGRRVLLYLIVVAGVLRLMTVSVFAEENSGEIFNERAEKNLKVTSEIRQNEKNEQEGLNVVLYDRQGRKLLLKKDFVWKVSEDILLAIPLDELDKTGGKVTVLYEDMNSGKVKKYEFNCCRK